MATWRCKLRVLAVVSAAFAATSVAGSSSVAYAQPVAAAPAWLKFHSEAVKSDLAEAASELAKADAALAQANAAIALARDYKDADALRVATDARDTALEAQKRAKGRLNDAKAAGARIEAAATVCPLDATGMAAKLSGSVTMTRAGGASRRWDGEPVSFQPGDRITTAAGSTARLIFEGGSVVDLAANSTFVFTPKPKADPKAPLGQRVWGELKAGLLRLTEKTNSKRDGFMGGFTLGSLNIRTPTAVVAVRGTSFLMNVGADGGSVFTPISGGVDLSAEGATPVRPEWWLPPPAATAGPVDGAQVATLRGSVRIETAKGDTRPASAGEKIAIGEHLITGPDSGAILELADGYRVAVGPDARLDAGADVSSKAALYALRRGRIHVWGSGMLTKARFLTPNTVAAPEAKEFEVAVGANGVAEYAVVTGKVSIEAFESRLDWTKVDAWWEK